jgi:hypothetical protein
VQAAQATRAGTDGSRRSARPRRIRGRGELEEEAAAVANCSGEASSVVAAESEKKRTTSALS